MSVVNVIQILQTEQMSFETIVQLARQQLLKYLTIANGVVHQMDLFAEYQEVEQFRIFQHHWIVVVQLN